MDELMTIKLELTVDEVNAVLSLIAKAPYETAEPLISKIRAQALPQVNPPAPVENVA